MVSFLQRQVYRRRVGLVDGEMEGDADGLAEGLALGEAEGLALGLADGLSLGLADGLGDFGASIKTLCAPRPVSSEFSMM